MQQIAALVLVANLMHIYLMNLAIFYKIGTPKIEERKNCDGTNAKTVKKGISHQKNPLLPPLILYLS